MYDRAPRREVRQWGGPCRLEGARPNERSAVGAREIAAVSVIAYRVVWPGSEPRQTSASTTEARVSADRAPLHVLMQRYADGDPRAFAALHVRLETRLRGLLRSLVGPTGPVDDLFQVAMMRAHLARTRFAPISEDRDGAVVAWYAAIARNAARDWMRAQRHDTSRPSAEAPQLDEHAADGTNPESAKLDEETDALMIGRVRDALAQLPPRQRELIEMHKLRGMPFAEIAQRLGVREGAARVRAHRAYRALSRLLASGSRGGAK